MELLRTLFETVKPAIPVTVAIAAIAVAMAVVHRIFEKRIATHPQAGFKRQITILLLSFVGLLIVIVVSPLGDTQKGQLLSLIGLLLSAAIALSSTTFLGNALAGFMLRVVRSFRIGDFIRIGDHFGRVSERGLFHTEIQTEDRDLMTLPNLYLVTNPVKVVRSSGTIISAEVSLGYDVPRQEVEKLLLEAATEAELDDPYVHMMELGDFSVTYRIAGLLTEVKHIISKRSRLRAKILDALHGGGVEIVSPNFMNTRALAEGRQIIPRVSRAKSEPEIDADAESIIFDKAEEAESAEKLQGKLTELCERITEHEQLLKDESSDEKKEQITKQIERLKSAQERMAELVKRKAEKLDE